jgi:hypothetical protein
MSPRERINPRYRDALLEARTAGFRFTRQQEQQLVASYAEIISQISRDFDGRELTAERARRLHRETLGAMVRFESRMVELTRQGMAMTAREVERIHREVVADLFRPTGLSAPDMDRIASRALGTMASRGETAAAFETLARRKLLAVSSELDTMLQAGVARGIDAGRGTVDVARLLAGDDPRLLEAVRRLREAGPDFIRQVQAGAGAVPWEAYGLEPGELREVRTLFYDARRIQVSEMSNALREANTEGLRQSPVVLAAKWEVSGRHDLEGDPDECSVLHTADYYGMGPGMYPPDKWPLAPHPHCQCHQGGPVRFRPPSQWGQDKPPAPPLGRRPDDPELLKRFSGSWTENRQARVAALLRGTIGEAEKVDRERRAAS